MFLLGSLDYSDDTAMARCVVRSILARAGYDERDMAHRCTDELPLLEVNTMYQSVIKRFCFAPKDLLRSTVNLRTGVMVLEWSMC